MRSSSREPTGGAASCSSRTRRLWPNRSDTRSTERATPSPWRPDGRRAIERFHDMDPELVILDLMLPELSGLDVVR